MINACGDCASDKCAFCGCPGRLLDASEHDYRITVDSKYIVPVKGKSPPPPYPKKALRHHRVCDTCGTLFYHLHEIGPVATYGEDGQPASYVYPPEKRLL